MSRFFRNVPLSIKLILIGAVPLAFIIFLTWQLLNEKNKNLDLIKGYVERIEQADKISNLILSLQKEQKLSYDYAIKKDDRGQLTRQRSATDSILQVLHTSDDPVLRRFEEYTSLNKLAATRKQIDSNRTDLSQITIFYSTCALRLTTLTGVNMGPKDLPEKFNNDIRFQKVLANMLIYLSIIRSNMYNVLVSKKLMSETLIALYGTYEVYRSYETELQTKSSPSTLQAYNTIRNSTDLKPTIDYINSAFATFALDSTYDAQQWWTVSESGLNQLSGLEIDIWQQMNKEITTVYTYELFKKNRALVLLVIVIAIVIGIIAFTIFTITKMLDELKTGAKKIAAGNTIPVFNIASKDSIGSLADSIVEINENNKQLAKAAEAIGKGNFDVTLVPRSDADILANSINQMKSNLQHSMKEIEERELEFKQMADLIPQMVWRTDSTGKITYFNKKWEEYLGNNDLAAAIHPDDIPVAKTSWEKCFREDCEWSIEVRYKNYKTKEYRWFLVRGIPVKDATGKTIKWLGTCTDIDNRKKISDDLQILVDKRTDELKRSNDDLMQFAHVASHDLKEPLRKVQIFINLLAVDLGDNISEKSKNYLSKILSSAKRQLKLIDGVLSYSTINTTSKPFEIIDLGKLIHDITGDLEVIIQQKQAIIRHEKLPAIKGIPILIQQLFYNLINNGLKFSKEDIPPVIEISAEEQMPGQQTAALQNGGYLQIKIEDNGIGFNSTLTEKVFQAFIRLHSPTKYEGTGLGLALCKKIMSRHDGLIYVESEENKGSVFYLLFPMKNVVQQTAAENTQTV